MLKFQSLKNRLLIAISLIIVVFGAIISINSYTYASKQIDSLMNIEQEIFAHQLILINPNLFTSTYKSTAKTIQPIIISNLESDLEIQFLILNKGKIIFSSFQSSIKFNLPTKITNNFFTCKINNTTWKCFYLPTPNKLNIIVLQPISYRNQKINKAILIGTYFIFLTLFFIIIIINIILNISFKRIKNISKSIKNQDLNDITLIDTKNIPSEITPLIDGLNYFTQRANTLIERERSFTSYAAHELKTPLTGLKIQAEVAKMSLMSLDSNAIESSLDKVIEGVNKTTELVENLLILTRIEHSLKNTFAAQEINISQILLSTLEEFDYFITLKKIHLKIDISPNIYILGNPEWIKMIFTNLISNSIKYSPEKATIDLFLDKDKFIIKDTGIGVPEKDLDKIGMAFFRVNQQNKNSTGLGLAIVKNISNMHKFNIKFSNNKPKGFIVLIDFNRADKKIETSRRNFKSYLPKKNK
ncbi:MAG: ATP-binding protein [Psittacicella sp.]